MKAYAVLSGGGVRGVALAGCLKAAKESDVEFVGYGGASVGAIIAYLAALGIEPDRMLDLFATRLAPSAALHDRGSKFMRLAEWLRELRGALSVSRKAPIHWISSSWRFVLTLPVLPQFWFHGGLYDGKLLREALLAIAKSELGLPDTATDLTFRELWERRRVELKILASDITRRRAALYSRNHDKYGTSVLNAVIASMSYPFVFRPVRQRDGHRYAGWMSDGGLSSNFPAFLFSEEHSLTRHPVIAFSLRSEERSDPARFNLLALLDNLLRTALEAGDNLFLAHIEGVHHVPVEESSIGVLKFDLTADETRTLFTTGHSAASTSLSQFELLKTSRQAGGEIKKQLWTIYGAPRLFIPVLDQLVRLIADNSEAKELRAHIMLPTLRPSGSRIVAYVYNARVGDGDVELEIGEAEGCSGAAMARRLPTVVDLTNPDAELALKPDNFRKIPGDRKALISAPIFAWRRGVRDVSSMPVIGVVSIDTATPLDQTKWISPASNGSEEEIAENVLRAMVEVAEILGKLLH